MPRKKPDLNNVPTRNAFIESARMRRVGPLVHTHNRGVDNRAAINDALELVDLRHGGPGIKVYLDDVRPAPAGWRGCQTAQQCIDLLSAERVTHLSLDHDLGPDEAETGYAVLRWMEDAVFLDGYVPPEVIHVHSANPVGRANMLGALRAIDRELARTGVRRLSYMIARTEEA